MADGEVSWLSVEQQASWRAYLLGAARLNDALNRQMEREAGLSLSEYGVLVCLSEAEGRMLRMSELAASLYHSRSRLTHTVGRLEDRGLVERRGCPHDRRGVFCVMTEAGYQHLESSAPGHVRAVREQLVDRLTDDELCNLGVAMGKVAPAEVPAGGCSVDVRLTDVEDGEAPGG
jgi:DNA-binding MarR family transcriptional regulator